MRGKGASTDTCIEEGMHFFCFGYCESCISNIQNNTRTSTDGVHH
jgi:hypothetical protein